MEGVRERSCNWSNCFCECFPGMTIAPGAAWPIPPYSDTANKLKTWMPVVKDISFTDIPLFYGKCGELGEQLWSCYSQMMRNKTFTSRFYCKQKLMLSKLFITFSCGFLSYHSLPHFFPVFVLWILQTTVETPSLRSVRKYFIIFFFVKTDPVHNSNSFK